MLRDKADAAPDENEVSTAPDPIALGPQDPADERMWLLTMTPDNARSIAAWLSSVAYWSEYGSTDPQTLEHAIALAESFLGGDGA